MFLGCLIALLAVIAVAVVAMCSAHIPGLRDLTGAAPLQDEEPGPCPCAQSGGTCQRPGDCVYGCADAADEHTRLSQDIAAGEVAS